MKTTLCLSLLLAATTPAFAADFSEADPGYNAPAASSPLTWTGLYLGLQGGYGWGSSEHSFVGGPGNGAPSDNSHPDGVLGGAYLGYSYQVDRVVLGIEADIEAADLSGSFLNLSGITSTGSAHMTWDASLRARFGRVFGSSLLYLTGGVAVAGYDFGGGPAPPPPCCAYSDTLTGWTAGVGWEYAMNRWFTWRLEYRYTDYGRANGPLNPFFPTTNMPTENKTSVVRVGVSHRF